MAVAVRRLPLAARSAIVAITTIVGAAAKSQDASPMSSWIDRYYADYTAMSAAPTGPAMDTWLAHYASFAFFEDPTAALSAIGHDRIRKPYLEAFTGPLGPVRWTIRRRITSGDWTAVEGWLDVNERGKLVHTRFATWFKVRDGKIVHQIDYVDYDTWRRNASGQEGVSPDEREPPALPGPTRPAERAQRLAAEFYLRYEAIPVPPSATGLARFLELLTEDFLLEDPTGRLRYESRRKLQASLKEALATGDLGLVHWEIDHAITDGEWVAVEGTWRGVYKRRPFAARFTTWLQVRGDKIARQIDYLDYPTFRRMTSSPRTP
jgi:ketosteroid isomerase-like protein